MNIGKKLTMIAATAMLISTGASAGDHAILTDKSGMTLYVFDKDSSNESVCYGACANNWPPFIAGANADVKGYWGTIVRKDGSTQWTYKNKPLYTWIGDKQVGDTTGDGVGGTWHTAKKAGANTNSNSNTNSNTNTSAKQSSYKKVDRSAYNTYDKLGATPDDY